MREFYDFTEGDLLREFAGPDVEKWLNGSHQYGLSFYNGKRLMDPEERLAYLGKDNITSNLKITRNKNLYTVLQACRKDPSPRYDIYDFSKLAGRPLNLGSVNLTLVQHSELFDTFDGVTCINTIRDQPDLFAVYSHLKGYLTNMNGVTQTVTLAQTKTSSPLLVPSPQEASFQV